VSARVFGRAWARPSLVELLCRRAWSEPVGRSQLRQ